MSRARRKRPTWRLTRRGRRVVAAAMGTVLLTGVFLVTDGLEGAEGPPQPAAAAAAASKGGRHSAAGSPGTLAPAAPMPASEPLGIRIPSLGVDAPVMNVGLDANGWVAPPPADDENLTGWYEGSAPPGAEGTSVLVGHVDTNSGPAVFFGLGALKKDNTVQILREDGTVAVFLIYGVELFEKDAFPARRVYGDTGGPELRLITCGGNYTPAGGYTGNVVVFARLVNTN